MYSKKAKVMICALTFFICIGFSVTENLFAEVYSLDDLYRIALERAERIKISEEDLFVAERGKDKALSLLFPKLSAFGTYTRYSEAKITGQGWAIQPDWSASWGLRLDQSLSLGGRELSAFNISKENIEKSGYDLDAVREDYLLSVASAYYDVLRAKKALEIANANVDRLRKHRDAAAIRLKVGEVTKTDLLRAEAELSGGQSELVRAENNLKLTKAILARVVGLNEDYDIKEPDAKGERVEDYVLSSLKEKAFSERVELKSANLQKKIAENQVKYAKGSYWPSLSIEGVYSRRDEDPASPFFLEESIYGGLTLNFPFFEGGLRKAEVRESKAKQRQTVLAFEDLKKTIGVEVDNAYLDMMTQKGILKSLQDEVSYATENYNSISKQYQFGLANSIDVIDANTLLITSERQLADATYNFQLSILSLKKATGTLLKTVLAKK